MVNLQYFKRHGFGVLILCTILLTMAAIYDWQDRWYTHTAALHYFIKLWLYWMHWIAWPTAMLSLLHLSGAESIQEKLLTLTLCLTCCGVIWAGSIEPNVIRVRQTLIRSTEPQAQPLRLAVISDLHLGLFYKRWQLQRIVDRLNLLEVDAVLVAGDWTYEPHKDLQDLFLPLAQLRPPIYAVLGNHDLERPGPQLAQQLRSALSIHRVQWSEGRTILLKGWELIGLDDLWGGQPTRQIDALLSTPSQRRIILTHQPDTLELIQPGHYFLGIAGHSHGGQIKLPWLTDRVLEAVQRSMWIDGLYSTGVSHAFVTPGLGTSSLPFRLRVPPTIDLLLIQAP